MIKNEIKKEFERLGCGKENCQLKIRKNKDEYYVNLYDWGFEANYLLKIKKGKLHIIKEWTSEMEDNEDEVHNILLKDWIDMMIKQNEEV